MSHTLSPNGDVLDADRPANLVDEVWPRIWVGGSYAPYPAELIADVAILACPRWEVTGRGANARTTIDVPLRDGPISTAELHEIHHLADHLALLWHGGQTLAYRCYMGLNRSALIAGITRVKATGTPGAQVVAELRAARGPDALCNQAFAAHLETL